jgi:hypothetical protein
MKVHPPCARNAHGEGDRPKDGGGASLSQKSPSTTLRVVPLPIAFGDREDDQRPSAYE